MEVPLFGAPQEAQHGAIRERDSGTEFSTAKMQSLNQPEFSIPCA